MIVYCIFMAVFGMFVGICVASVVGIILPTTEGLLVIAVTAVLLIGLCYWMYRERTR